MNNDRTLNSVSTDAKAWQINCWDLAKAGLEFELDGVAEHHRMFCEELSVAYGYELEHHGDKVVFVPLNLN